MKQHLLFLSLLITVLPVGAQERKDTTTTDTLDMERVVHDLPEFVVKGERPIVRVQGVRSLMTCRVSLRGKPPTTCMRH